MKLMTEDEKWQKRALSRDQIGTLRYIQVVVEAANAAAPLQVSAGGDGAATVEGMPSPPEGVRGVVLSPFPGVSEDEVKNWVDERTSWSYSDVENTGLSTCSTLFDGFPTVSGPRRLLHKVTPRPPVTHRLGVSGNAE
jgi:hypothetical protein